MHAPPPTHTPRATVSVAQVERQSVALAEVLAEARLDPRVLGRLETSLAEVVAAKDKAAAELRSELGRVAAAHDRVVDNFLRKLAEYGARRGAAGGASTLSRDLPPPPTHPPPPLACRHSRRGAGLRARDLRAAARRVARGGRGRGAGAAGAAGGGLCVPRRCSRPLLLLSGCCCCWGRRRQEREGRRGPRCCRRPARAGGRSQRRQRAGARPHGQQRRTAVIGSSPRQVHTCSRGILCAHPAIAIAPSPPVPRWSPRSS